MTHNSANPKMETNTLKLNYELSQNIKIIFGTKAEFHFTFGHLSIPYSNPLTASHLTQKKKLKLFLWGVGIATILVFVTKLSLCLYSASHCSGSGLGNKGE